MGRELLTFIWQMERGLRLTLAGRCESNVLSTDILSDGDEMRGNLDEDAGIDNIPAIFRFPVIQGRSDENNRQEHHKKVLDRRNFML